MSKLSSKILIFHPSGKLYAIYRAPGPWNNPNKFSLIGTDGPLVEGVIQQIMEKFSLKTMVADWVPVAESYNEVDDEKNFIWRHKKELNSLLYDPSAYGGLICVNPSDLWEFDRLSMLSPSAKSVMLAMPEIFSHPDSV